MEELSQNSEEVKIRCKDRVAEKRGLSQSSGSDDGNANERTVRRKLDEDGLKVLKLLEGVL